MTRLEGRGLIRREPCAQDGRATNVVLTETGAEYVTDAAPGHLATVRATVMDSLTPDQIAQLAEHKLSDVCETIV